jgi:hypothetical protein
MQLTPRVLCLFLFAPEKFSRLAYHRAQAGHRAKIERRAFPESRPSMRDSSHRSNTLKVRQAFSRSLQLVASVLILGWVVAKALFATIGPAGPGLSLALQYGGIGILLWATLAKGGWTIQTIGGETLPELIDQRLYRVLYLLGSFILAISASWPRTIGAL